MLRYLNQYLACVLNFVFMRFNVIEYKQTNLNLYCRRRFNTKAIFLFKYEKAHRLLIFFLCSGDTKNSIRIQIQNGIRKYSKDAKPKISSIILYT